MKSTNIQSNNDHPTWHCVTTHMNESCSTECLLRSVFDLLGKKFTLLIIRLLLINGSMRFSELEKEIKGSPKTLTQRLRDMENKGLINRSVFKEIPIRVEYSLTEAGLRLDSVFETISTWVKSWVSK